MHFKCHNVKLCNLYTYHLTITPITLLTSLYSYIVFVFRKVYEDKIECGFFCLGYIIYEEGRRWFTREVEFNPCKVEEIHGKSERKNGLMSKVVFFPFSYASHNPFHHEYREFIPWRGSSPLFGAIKNLSLTSNGLIYATKINK